LKQQPFTFVLTNLYYVTLFAQNSSQSFIFVAYLGLIAKYIYTKTYTIRLYYFNRWRTGKWSQYLTFSIRAKRISLNCMDCKNKTLACGQVANDRICICLAAYNEGCKNLTTFECDIFHAYQRWLIAVEKWEE